MNVATNAKAYVALAGTIATALLGVYAADSTVGKVLTIVSVVATAFGTWYVENKPKADERGESALVVALLVAMFVIVLLFVFGPLRHC